MARVRYVRLQFKFGRSELTNRYQKSRSFQSGFFRNSRRRFAFVIVEDGLQEWRYQQTEFANLFGAAGNVNQVITELGFYRPQYFINRTAKDHFVELFDHLTGSKFTK